MTTLHVVNHPDALASCLLIATKEDVVLLIEEAAVPSTLATSPMALEQPLLVLEEHLPPGTNPDQLPDTIARTNFEGFVQLVARCQPIVTWS